MPYKYDVCKLLFLLEIILFTFLENSEGIEEIHNEAEEAQNSTFSTNQNTYQEIELALNSTDSEKDSVSSLIIGGHPAGEGQFPYQVSLRTTSGEHFCGGSIISNKWILTAAECVRWKTVSDLTIVVGAVLLNSGGTSYKVNRIIPHPLYNSSTHVNDIALIEVIGTIGFTGQVNKIRIANVPTFFQTTAVLTGWGSTSYPPDNQPNNLQYIKLATLILPECLSQLPVGTSLTLASICTLTQSGQGACQGDSGGPLVELDNGRLEKQIGIFSWGTPCAVGKPDVYTSVAAYRSWILLNTGIMV